ncbi:UNVERIFIED_CONTAM: Phospholipid:diacylglycerol acyltransferase 1 [Sesamum calycinum]|uniref:Phospholipid:diacylglycerol acyltransferase 1 n=1 Tax=Sesamum calycinum TaxID=2727403 RepID=A0AAW2NT41_9LAMI
MAIMRRRKGGGGKRSENSEQQLDENKEKKGKESEENSKSGSPNLNLNLHSGSAAKKSRRKWSCVDGCCWFIGCICSMWWFLLFLYNAMPASFPQYVTEAITGPLPDPPGVKLAKDGLKAKHPVVFVPGIVTGGLELWEGHACAEGLFRKRLWGGTFGEVYKRPLCWVEHMSLDNETGLDPPVRDQTLSRIKSNIELMVATSGGKKVVVVPHSMGVLYFLHFMKWVEAPKPMGGGGGPNWAIAPGVLDRDVFGFQTLQHVMRMTRTWDSTMSMIPKGGDTIWGGLDWSPEEGHACSSKKNSNGQIEGYNRTEDLANSGGVKYGRIISFGKDVADLHSSDIGSVDFRGALKGNNLAKHNLP